MSEKTVNTMRIGPPTMITKTKEYIGDMFDPELSPTMPKPQAARTTIPTRKITRPTRFGE